MRTSLFLNPITLPQSQLQGSLCPFPSDVTYTSQAMSHKIDLTNAPDILFFFGKAGAGKSHVAKLIGELTDWYVYEADNDVTDEMALALKESRPFTGDMRDNFFEIITEKILQLQKSHKRLVVTQGVYKQQHRDYLINTIPELELVCVDASDLVIAERLGKRSNGITLESARALIADYEPPTAQCRVITNEKDNLQIVTQLNQLFGYNSENSKQRK